MQRPVHMVCFKPWLNPANWFHCAGGRGLGRKNSFWRQLEEDHVIFATAEGWRSNYTCYFNEFKYSQQFARSYNLQEVFNCDHTWWAYCTFVLTATWVFQTIEGQWRCSRTFDGSCRRWAMYRHTHTQNWTISLCQIVSAYWQNR